VAGVYARAWAVSGRGGAGLGDRDAPIERDAESLSHLRLDPVLYNLSSRLERAAATVRDLYCLISEATK
jgi:hypothetical protein